MILIFLMNPMVYRKSIRVVAPVLVLSLGSLGACDVDEMSETGPPAVHYESPAHALVAEFTSPSAAIEALRPALRSLVDSVRPQFARIGRPIDRVALNVDGYRAIREGFIDRGESGSGLGQPEVWPEVELLGELGYPAYEDKGLGPGDPRNQTRRGPIPTETTLVIRPGSLAGVSGSHAYLWASVSLRGGAHTRPFHFRIDLNRDAGGVWRTEGVSAIYEPIN